MKRLIPALLALGLVACGPSGADTTSTTASPTVTTIEAPETGQPPASTSTIPAIPSTTEPPTEVLSASGFWEVRIGETLAENEDRIGIPLESAAGEDDTRCVVFRLPEVGGIYFIAAAPSSEPVNDRGDLVVGRVTATDPGWATSAGVEVEMSVAGAEAILGDTIVDRQPHTYVEGGQYLIVGPEDARYVYETDGTIITAIHAGIEPVVSYVETCA